MKLRLTSLNDQQCLRIKVFFQRWLLHETVATILHKADHQGKVRKCVRPITVY